MYIIDVLLWKKIIIWLKDNNHNTEMMNEIHKIGFINMIIGEEEYQYIVFSVYKIEKEEYYLTTNFDKENSFADYIKRAKTRSIKDFNIEVSNKDSLLTLSTCADSNKLRVVMHSKKINSSKITK